MPDFLPGRPDRVRELCRKLKPIVGLRMDQLYWVYCTEDMEGKKQIEMYLEVLAGKYLSGALDDNVIDLVPPSREQAAGPYGLGTVMYARKPLYPFGLREGEWIKHLAVFGISGAGKTNLGFEIFRQLITKGTPVLVFDWKRNYRDLLTLPEFQDVDVYTVGRNVAPFHFNPLIPPPGTDAKTWLKQIIEVVAHAYCLGNGVLYLLQDTLNTVYEEHGVYCHSVRIWPTFRDVLIRARERNARGRESAWLASTLRALSSLTFGEMDKTLTQGHGQDLDRLLTKSTILEMDSLGQADKVFLISALLLYIHHRRMAEGEREQLKHAILIEEAHHVLSNERQSLIGGQSVMEITFREIREFGEGIVILDQHPSKISLSALGNTYCTICLNLKHQKDVSAMGQSMLLDSNEKDILGSLEVGQAVVKLQGRAPRPFRITIPEFEITKGSVDDAAVRQRMAWAIVPEPVLRREKTSVALIQDNEHRSAPRPTEKPRDILFLTDIRDHPESGVAARYKRLGISVRQGHKVKKLLAGGGLIEEREEHTETGRLNVLRLTEKGRRLLENPP